MEIELLVTDVTAVVYPDRAERAILGVVDFGWAIFSPIQDIFVVAEPLCDYIGTSSWALITLLRVI